MTDFYARLQATATRLIADKGKPGTIIRVVRSGPAHNPVVAETEYAVSLVETGYSLTNRGQTLISESGPLIQAGDKLGLIGAGGEAPQLSDQIEIDGIRHSFVDLKPLNPGGVTVLYEFHARR